MMQYGMLLWRGVVLTPGAVVNGVGLHEVGGSSPPGLRLRKAATIYYGTG